MKSIPLRNITAPSPAVLSFLRTQVKNAFESPIAQCAASNGVGHRRLSMRRRAQETELWPANRSVDLRERFGGNDSKASVTTPSQYFRSQAQDDPLSICRSSAFSSSFKPPSYVQPFQCHRAFSSSSKDSAWNLWRARRLQRPPPVQAPTSPLSGLMEDTSSGSIVPRSARSANELKMRCTELDENGNVTMVSGEFKKSELIAKYGLLPRDLRKIDSSLLPHILVRPSAILINLLHLRALIRHNRVLVFDAYGTSDSKSQSVFMYDLDLKLRQKESAANGILSYEFRALEAVLINVTLGLEKEFEGVSQPVVKVLMELEEDIDRDKLRHLLIYSKKLSTFEQKARLVRDALTEILEADDDLSAMYLSEKAQGKTRDEHDHTEVEMLLESYHKVADEIVQAAENLVSSIRNTEEIVKAILDANRNSLMLLDLRFSILTLSITAGTFVAALYGMNLKNFIEESDIGFFGISAWCTVFGMIVAAYCLQKLRKVQRVSMWAHGGGLTSTRGNGWGLGVWGGRSQRLSDCGDGIGGAAPRLRAGENLGDLIQRERALARKLARAEAKAEDAAKS